MVSPPKTPELALALDVPSLAEATQWVEQMDGTISLFKVGLQLFTKEGPAVVNMIHQQGGQVFLDLKFHDIPKTVEQAVSSACALGPRFLTIHTTSGPAAIAAAVRASESSGTTLLGVSVLTSLDTGDLQQLGWGTSPGDLMARLTQLGADQGLNGFVCSPQECHDLRQQLGKESTLVVPGIRPEPMDQPDGTSTGHPHAGDAQTHPVPEQDDQKRAATPAQAVRAGANVLVVGRPIRNAPNPRAAAHRILKQIQSSP